MTCWAQIEYGHVLKYAEHDGSCPDDVRLFVLDLQADLSGTVVFAPGKKANASAGHMTRVSSWQHCLKVTLGPVELISKWST